MTKFENFERSHGGRCAKTLLLNAKSSYTLKALYIIMHNAAVASTSTVIGGFAYTVRQMSNPELWNDLYLREKGAAGYCMARLVAKKDVPFVPAGKRGGSRKYELSAEHVRARVEAYRSKQLIEHEVGTISGASVTVTPG